VRHPSCTIEENERAAIDDPEGDGAAAFESASDAAEFVLRS
jgi:hypothetical protein